jgi:N-methylhydantoinase B
MKRERSRLLADLRDGYVTPEQARRDYGFDPAA